MPRILWPGSNVYYYVQNYFQELAYSANKWASEIIVQSLIFKFYKCFYILINWMQFSMFFFFIYKLSYNGRIANIRNFYVDITLLNCSVWMFVWLYECLILQFVRLYECLILQFVWRTHLIRETIIVRLHLPWYSRENIYKLKYISKETHSHKWWNDTKIRFCNGTKVIQANLLTIHRHFE